MLCAAFAIPALVQPAFADEEVSYAEQLFVEVIEAQTEFLTICNNVMEEDLSPAVAAVAIEKVNERITATLTKIGKLNDEDGKAFLKIILDEKVAEGVDKIDEACLAALAAFDKEDYYDNAAFKAACETFAELNAYED